MSEFDGSVLAFVAKYVGENGWAPSYREICDGVGVRSTSTVMKAVYALARHGMIRFGNGPRKIAMTSRGLEEVRVGD